MTMTEWLKDDPPISFNAVGDLCSDFYFEVCTGTCQNCHSPLVLICNLEQCPTCPEIMVWLMESRAALNRAKARLSKGITIELIPDHTGGY